MPSSLESTFEAYLRMLAPELLDGMVREYRIVPGRRYRWDYAWPLRKAALELHGGLWAYGAHSRPAGVQRDMAKANAATLAGWRVLFFSTDDIESDPESIVTQLRSLLEVRS